MFSSLTEIRGVGEKAAEKLLEHYGSEKEALSSLNQLELERLFPIDEIPRMKLIGIVRDVYARKSGFEYADVLKTQEARDIYAAMMEHLRDLARTEYARLRLTLLYPTKDEAEIKRRLDYAKKAKDLFAALSEEQLAKLKEAIARLTFINEKTKKRRIPGIAIAVESKELHDELAKRYGGLVEVFHLESQEDLEFLRNYESVRYVETGDSRLAQLMESIPSAEVVLDAEEQSILPEATLAFFGENKATILAAIEATKILRGTSAQKELDVGLKIGDLEKIAERIRLIEDAGVSTEASERLKRFTNALKNLHATVEKCLEEANAAMEEKADQRGIALKGRDVLKMIASLPRSGDVYGHLPKEVVDLLSSTAEEYEEELAKRLGMGDERLLFSGIFSEESKYPLEVSQEKLGEIEVQLTAEKAKQEMKLNREFAKELGRHKDAMRRLVAKALELDYALALGEFMIKYRASLPKINKKLGIAVRGARHLELTKKELNGDAKVQPISYAIGSAGIDIKGAKDERIVVITGANSGGKTMLLETLLQVQIAAQCGIPVAAEEANASMLDEVHFFAKRKGSGDAGAFEMLLKSFAELTKGKGKRLILTDEIEATTEPGAAANIISALLEWFANDKDALVGIVTHLGENTAKLAKAEMRIDGIEATGLDENLSLVVDRNPVLNKLARSTPELIVEKLSKTEKCFAEFYGHILKKFK